MRLRVTPKRLSLKCLLISAAKSRGAMNKTKSYMWVYTNGEYEQEGYQIWLYEYQPSRSGSFAGAFLRGYAGTLITDGYSGYERLDSQSHVLCWAHVRKYFVDALSQDLSSEEEEASISG